MVNNLTGDFRARTGKIAARLIPAALAVLLILAAAPPARAFDADQAFVRGGYVISAEAGIADADTTRIPSHMNVIKLGARFSLLPFGITGGGLTRGALEVGFEPFYERFRTKGQNWGGAGLALRYHLLGYGRLVPYVEGFAGVGGTDLKLMDLTSNYDFLLQIGFGASYFVTENIAPYLGFRLGHLSNAGLDGPDDGFQDYGAILGVSYFIR